MSERKKPGPKPSGRRPKRPMSFTITDEHRTWLDRLGAGKRSEWLGDQIEAAIAAGVVPEEYKGGKK